MAETLEYTEENIKTLEGVEHIRLRPGMYIGKLGDGSHPEDGIYVLIKEVIDNSIDEFRMGAGKVVDVTVKDGKVSVRDYGRGIPLGKLLDCVSILNTGAKYDSKAFKKSVKLIPNRKTTKDHSSVVFHLYRSFFQTAPWKSTPVGRTYSMNRAYSFGMGRPEAAGSSSRKYIAARPSQNHFTLGETSPLSSRCCRRRTAEKIMNGSVGKK